MNTKVKPNADHTKITMDAPVLLAAAIVLTVLLQQLLPLPFFPSLPSRVLGAILFVGGFAFGMPAFRGMRRAKTSPNPHRASTAWYAMQRTGSRVIPCTWGC